MADSNRSSSDRKLADSEKEQLSSEANANSTTATEPLAEKLPADDKASDVEASKKPLSPFDPASYPDGGWTAWLVVVGGFCCLFVSFGWINCVGIFQEYYQNNLLQSYSSSTVSWIVSLEIFCMFFFGPIVGKLLDFFGPRYVLLVGSFLHVFGLMMTSLCRQYYQFILAQGICSPIGASMIFYAGLTSVSTWFFRKRAYAIGIMASGSSLGGVIFPIMIQRLIPRIGFPWTMRAAAFMILGLLIIANLTVKSRIPPNKRPTTLMEFIRPLGERTYFLVVFASFLFFFGLFLPFNYVIVSAIRAGMDPELAGYLVPILNAVSIFGRVLPGFVADKLGRFNVMTVVNLTASIWVLAIWIPAKSNAGLIVFSALYGFSSGTFVSLIGAVVAQISKIQEIGVRNGTLFAICSIAGLCSNPIGGALIDADGGDFVKLQIFSGVMLLGGTIFFAAARVSEVGLKLKAKV